MAPNSENFTIAGGHPFLPAGTVCFPCRNNPNHVRIVSGGTLWCPPGTVLSVASADVLLRPGAEKEKTKKKNKKSKKARKAEKKKKEETEKKKKETEEEKKDEPEEDKPEEKEE